MTGEEIVNAIDEYLLTLDKKDYRCVNWGDLGCTSVTRVEEIYPENSKYFEAIIEEASPDNYGLCDNISVFMAEKHGIDIRIKCEW